MSNNRRAQGRRPKIPEVHVNTTKKPSVSTEPKTLYYLVYMKILYENDYCVAQCSSAAEAKAVAFGLYMGLQTAHTPSIGTLVTGYKESGEYEVFSFGVDATPTTEETSYVTKKQPE